MRFKMENGVQVIPKRMRATRRRIIFSNVEKK